MIKIYGVRFKEKLDDKIFDSLLSIVGDIQTEKILKFKFWQDRHRSLLGKLLVYHSLKNEFGIDKFPEIQYGNYGRPYQDINPMYDFNITHSGEYVFFVITDRGRIGIDVEKNKNISVEIAERFFSEHEVRYLKKLPEKLMNHEMIKIWTLKESYIKAKGSTFLIPLDKFYFDISGSEIVFFTNLPEEKIEWKFDYFQMEDNHQLSVCYEYGNNIISFSCENLDDFVKYFI